MNISDLKKELQKYNLSSSTPGLSGDDRYEELKSRLEIYLSTFNKQLSPKKNNKNEEMVNDETNNDENEAESKLSLSNLQSLTIGELRSRLTSLGVSTNTPGITGEERWKALLKRYTQAISGQNIEDENEEKVEEKIEENEIIEVKKKEDYKKPSRPSVAPPITIQVVEEPPLPDPISEPSPPSSPQLSIHEYKKKLDRLLNQRSQYIASSYQTDRFIISLNNNILLVEKSLENASPNDVEGLNEERENLKSQVVSRKNAIKLKAESNEEFGLMEEELLRSKIAKLASKSTKLSVTGPSNGRPITSPITTLSEDLSDSTLEIKINSKPSSASNSKPSSASISNRSVSNSPLTNNTTKFELDLVPEPEPIPNSTIDNSKPTSASNLSKHPSASNLSKHPSASSLSKPPPTSNTSTVSKPSSSSSSSKPPLSTSSHNSSLKNLKPGEINQNSIAIDKKTYLITIYSNEDKFSTSPTLSLDISSPLYKQSKNSLKIIELCKLSQDYEKENDYSTCEFLLEKALDLDPFHFDVLQLFSLFLYRRKGEILRAQSFFNRILQIYLPSFYNDFQFFDKADEKKILLSNFFTSNYKDIVYQSNVSKDSSTNNSKPVSNPSLDSVSIKMIINFLINFSNFFIKSKGDSECAKLLLMKAVSLSPTNSKALSHLANFLTEQETLVIKTKNNSISNINSSSLPSISLNSNLNNDSTLSSNSSFNNPPPPSSNKLTEVAISIQKLFDLSLKYDIKNDCHITLWYAKFFKKINDIKNAEKYYQESLKRSQELTNLSKKEKYFPLSLCNYATFLFKYKKDKAKAMVLFEKGLELYPFNSKLKRNFNKLRPKELYDEDIDRNDDNLRTKSRASSRLEKVLSSGVSKYLSQTNSVDSKNIEVNDDEIDYILLFFKNNLLENSNKNKDEFIFSSQNNSIKVKTFDSDSDED